ncbi:hypothetical protein Gogos_010443 [Gossypium gossypioides]|uniref:RNase H type-1 domain-containing protein n=1 Tax=Gossypium gossypioides TaxID=34282 RepID=A0A7J9BL98_GOSGO|nr:hypothetical protein [Gossypium gossypioides]
MRRGTRQRWKLDHGIQLILRRAIIQTDNLEVVQALTYVELEDLGIIVFRRTQRIMRAKGQWRINHISIEQNLEADRLAKLSLNWKSTLQVFDESPKKILEVLQKDKANDFFMHLM